MGFFDGTGKAIKFEVVNGGGSGFIVGQLDPATGQLAPYVTRQATDFNTKAPRVYPDGNPIMEAVVVLQTDQRDDAEDDGQRTLYIGKARQRRAIQQALREVGARDLEVGGSLAIWLTGEERTDKGNTAKTFAAQYFRPVGSLGSPAPATATAAAPVATPVAAPVAAPAAAPVAAAPVAPPVAAPVAPPVATVAAPPVAAAPVAVAAPVAAPVAPVAPSAPPVAAPVAPVAPAPVAAPVAPATVAAPVAPSAGSEDLPF